MSKKISTDTQNPGSALGEAIGACIEVALNEYIHPIVEDLNCRLITKGHKKGKSGNATKLLLHDIHGTAYNIDGVITNESMQPLILLEYKYIRYKKHNRDKGSWVCTAHTSVKRRFNSIRSSIAILAGNWSKSSVAMMKSNDINIFIVPFSVIADILATHDIDFNWGEKDRHIAVESWKKYQALTDDQKKEIAVEIIETIKAPLLKAITAILDNQTERAVEKVTIEIYTNLGEVKRFEFATVDDALNFLEDFTIEEMLDHTNSFTILDPPPVILDDDEDDDEDAESESKSAVKEKSIGANRDEGDFTGAGPLFDIPS
jgi:hypothetical protein